MTKSLLGSKIKELRLSRGWSQEMLAIRSGLSRSHISMMELRKYVHPRADVLLKLARAFDIPVDELYWAAGYETGTRTERRVETPEEILERLRLAHPVSVPVYIEFPFHAGEPTEPVQYVYRERAKSIDKNIEGYVVHGNCLEPDIKDGDVIIVDRDGQIDNGNIVACLLHDFGHLYLARLREIAGERYLENNDGRIKLDECQVSAPVIEVIRRLK